jgi:lambda family phage minor tail protein L
MTILQDVVQPALGAWVDLFTIDATAIGASVYHFTSATDRGSSVSFGGIVYTALPIDSNGFQASSSGALPRPKLTISNVNKFLQPYILANNYFQGAKVTRIRTLDKYLDGHPNADSTQFMPQQVWYIDAMTTMTKQIIEFSLVSPLDRPTAKLPMRQILRDAGFPGAGFPYLT